MVGALGRLLGGGRVLVGPVGCGLAHLQVGEVPGAVVLLAARPGERRPEVHLDQLPVGAEADVAEDAGEGTRSGETALFGPRPHLPPVQSAAPQASVPACTVAQRYRRCPGRAALGLTAVCYGLRRQPAPGRVAGLGSQSWADSLPLPCTGLGSSLGNVPASPLQVPTANNNNSHSKGAEWSGGPEPAPNSQWMWAGKGCP